MLVLKMVLLLSCHGAQLMANVDAISPNGLAMTASEFSPNAEDMHGLQSRWHALFFLPVLADVH